jgi:hypothetical protein
VIGRAGIAFAFAVLVLAAPAAAYTPQQPWPPATGSGVLFVHFGEEHWNDADGLTLLPKVVEDTARYAPNLVTLSGDKANDGVTEELSRWEEIMGAYDRAGIPYYAGVGNHDRDSYTSGGLPPPGPLDAYVDVFRDRPYPFGDAQPKADPLLSPAERPAGDPDGAASHYFVDYANVRWVFLDNSCFTIDDCDMFQQPSAQTRSGEGQFEFLQRVGGEASAAGRHVFVVMHMPTRDPGDQSYRDPIAVNHVMAKGETDDNDQFERVANSVGVDGVFVGHIKGQFLYRGRGRIQYYIDGGAGGELYTEGPVGTDHGFWHGYRLIRVDGERIETDSVPIFVPDGIRIEGADRIGRGERLHLEAFGMQPVFNDPAKVPALELRDPDPRRPGGTAANGLAEAGPWLALPLALMLLLGLAARFDLLARGGLAPLLLLAVLVGASGFGAVSLAQQSEPTTTPLESLPKPARIWTSGNPHVLAPVASEDDDPRRDAAAQTDSGVFEATCPGRSTIEIVSGWEAQRKEIAVPSASGPIVSRLRRGARRVEAGDGERVASVLLQQPAQVLVRVKRGRRVVRTLLHDCVEHATRAAWDGTVRRGGRERPVSPGLYTVEVRIRSDRRPTVRNYRVRVTR